MNQHTSGILGLVSVRLTCTNIATTAMGKTPAKTANRPRTNLLCRSRAFSSLSSLLALHGFNSCSQTRLMNVRTGSLMCRGMRVLMNLGVSLIAARAAGPSVALAWL